MKVKRSNAFSMRFEPRPSLDIGAMLQGNLEISRDEPIVATSFLTGRTTTLTRAQLDLLYRASGLEWRILDELFESDDPKSADEHCAGALLESGLLISDSMEPHLTFLREKEERLAGLEWDDFALQYHVTSRHRDLDAAAALRPTLAEQGPSIPIGQSPTLTVGQSQTPSVQQPGTASAEPAPPAQDAARRSAGDAQGPFPRGYSVVDPVPFAGAASVLMPPTPGIARAPQDHQVPMDEASKHYALSTLLAQQLQTTLAQHGPPPSHFHTPNGIIRHMDLPAPAHQGPFFDLLRQRRTVRIFDPHDSMTLEELSTLLHYTYGCLGYAHIAPGVISLKKTSPSGGAMHPVEAYPLILQVRGLQPGLYHYGVERHALRLIRPMSTEEGRGLVERFTSGQTYYRTAHAVFILTARFFRNFWKYRKAQKAYKVVHLDAGHLSQTLYLLATALGLGAFFTGAVNDLNIEETLGIDGVQEGVIGISGCGRPWRGGHALTFDTQPYHPRLTRLG